ncbi:MAG TPA: WYL domain-containing protein [Candidatus Krumholzibacteria bacterium]|nr:WYL domain-containing protein [Candidatus Krumholzibacteria bacterium]HPD73356.1 WYL domain-containing protein [Candidatus Krumholzibacteria bacterium]HRY42123.1 WYL domain-containing protein [Candidatus Krumholzibacteria bacterium]
MPTKRAPDTSYGQKLVALFARLLFTGAWHGLADLARDLGCSKQTVLRLVDDITLSYEAAVESKLERGKRFYRIARSVPGEPAAMLTPQEMDTLLMCRAFTRHLLGNRDFTEAERALEKTSQLLAGGKGGGAGGGGELGEARFGVFRPGSIDYTPFMGFLHTVSEAIRERRVCEAEYRKPGERRSKVFRFKPLKVFSWRESIYVHGRYAATPGKPWKDVGYDPIWALQRFRRVEKTAVKFKWPDDYDFEKGLNREFGLLRGEKFRVVAEFTGWAADYVAEREWSPGQKAEWTADGRLRLEFDAVSLEEVATWVVSFGAQCRALSPRSLLEAIADRLVEVGSQYPEQLAAVRRLARRATRA